MNYKTEEILIIFLAFAIMIATVFITDPNIFGYVTHSPSFTYNESLIDTANGYSLLQQTETTIIENSTQYNSSITSAIYNGQDKTSKLQNLDDNTLNIQNKNKIFDVTFDHELNNNDVITFYIKGNKNTDVYLCPVSTSCDSPGYGLFNYPGEEGYYTITISNLENSANSFNIDPKKIKFDYAYATYTENNNYNITNTTYPESAILISDFIEPANLSSWGLLEKTETLNNQSILYEYSTDTEYNTIENFNLSDINSTKIKFRVTLQSDKTNTPILHNLTLNYYSTEQENPPEINCTENWNCTNWLECINETQIRTCTDLNSCNTILNKPVELQNCTLEEPPSGGSSGGGGGGNAAPSTSYSTSSPSTVEISSTETKKQQKTISLYDFNEPSQEPKTITGSIVAEKKPTSYFVNVILFSLFVLVCYLFYKKLIKKKK